MRSLLHGLFFCFVFFWGCNDHDERVEQHPQTPAALQENNSKDYSSISKRSYGSGDLVESLYAGLVDTIAELKGIEKQIDFLNVAKTDSIQEFRGFNQKNNAYYSSAERYVSEINDSALREKIKAIVKTSQDKYKQQTGSYNELLKLLDSRSATLGELHIVLKVLVTLPLIEKYQKDNLPNTNSIVHVLKEFDKSIRKLDTLTKR